MENQLITSHPEAPPIQISAFESKESFEFCGRMALALSKSTIIPTAYQGKPENVLIAIEYSQRLKTSPLMVMQNLNIIKGKPGWSSSYIIAAINNCGRFTEPLQFELSGEGLNKGCIAFTFDKNGKRVESPRVTMQMAKSEGWLDKDGSKWKTMDELMLRYRSAAFFGRIHIPEILMGMHSEEEVFDIEADNIAKANAKNLAEALMKKKQDKVIDINSAPMSEQQTSEV